MGAERKSDVWLGVEQGVLYIKLSELDVSPIEAINYGEIFSNLISPIQVSSSLYEPHH